MLVQPGCRLVGKTIARGRAAAPAGPVPDRDRPRRARSSVRSVPMRWSRPTTGWSSPGSSGTIVNLEKIPGLVPAADARYEVSPVEQRGRQLCEAVISPSSPLVGQAVRDADFRALYDAAIVAVHRNGARLTNKVGDIRLHAGDTLLLQVGPDFSRAFRNNPDFYLVSDVEDSQPGPLRPGLVRRDHLPGHDHGVRQRQGRHHAGRLAGRRRDGRRPLHLGRPGAEVDRPARADRHRRIVRRRQGAGAVGRGQAVRRDAGRGDAMPGARPRRWRRSTSAPWSSTS